MLNINFDPFPVLTTERLVLREVTNDDVNEVFFLRSDDRVMKYIGRAKAESIDEAVKWVALVHDSRVKNEGICWGISLKSDPKKMIGNIGFWRMEKEHYRSEIGYVLYPDQQGKGIMSEALAAVLKYGFETMKLHSVEANIDPENMDSKNLLERNGFVREAYFRENFFFDGTFYDSAIYSLLAPKK
jgi:ribosomal-protein-alanine N-acetyltransferase